MNFRPLVIFVLVLAFLCSAEIVNQNICHADVQQKRPVITEEDGSPFVLPSKIKFPNGTVVDNGDLSVSIHVALDPHAILSAYHSDATPAAVTRGALISGQGATPTWSSLALGTVGKIIRSNGTDITYSTATYPDTATMGDLMVATAANAYGSLADVVAGSFLLSGGVGALPAYTTNITYDGTLGSGGLNILNTTASTSSTTGALKVTGGAGVAGSVYGGTGFVAGVDAGGGTPNTAGTMRYFSAGDNAFYTDFTAGTQTANATYTLPTAMATANSQALLGSTAGVLSWGTDFGANNITTTGTLSCLSATATGANGLTLGTDVGGGSPNIAGYIKMFSAGDNAFYNTFTSGTNTANATYTLPVAMPATTGMALISTDAGAMSWAAPYPASHVLDSSVHTITGKTAGQVVIASAADAFGFSTATYPATTTINQILYSSAANTVTGLATGNSSVLVTDGSGVPSLATDIPTAVTIGTKYIYRVDGTDVAVADGGTGKSSWTQYLIPYADTTTSFSQIAIGTAGQPLLSAGAGAPPAFGSDLATATTIGTAYIYRVAGTDVAVTDGGTGLSACILGDLLYGSGANTMAVLAGNTAATKKFLNQTGTGAVSAAPSWDALADADIPDVLSITQISNLTTNGFIKTSSSNGTLTIDTNTYLTAEVDGIIGNEITNVSGTTLTRGGTGTGGDPYVVSLNVGNANSWTAQQDFQSATSIVLGKDETGGTPNVPGVLKMFSAGDNAFYNTFTAGTNTANATYTLPVAMPASSGMALTSTDAGVMSWSAPAPAGHAMLSTAHNDSTAGAVARGSIITGQGGSPTWTALALGTVGKILRSDGTDLLFTTATYPTTTTAYQILYSSAANTIGEITTGNNGVLVTNGSGVPSIAVDIPTAVTIGSAYVYRASGTDVAVADGGTGLSSYAVGDIVYASGTGTLAGLADVAAGSPLISGGVNTAPAYATYLFSGTGAATYTFPGASKTLMANDGSNFTIASQAVGDLFYASSGTAITRLADVAAGQPLLSGGVTTAPAYAGYTLSGTAAQTYTFPGASQTLASLAGTETLTNKRITPRVTSIVSNANPTINTDNCDFVDITAQAVDIASMTTNLSGTPTNGQKLIIRFKDNATARAITWGASYEACGVALPTTTVLSKRTTVGLIYDTTTSKWGSVAVVTES